MIGREPIGYVVAVDGAKVTLNLLDRHRGMVAGHTHGVSQVTEIGCWLGIDSGNELLVFRVDGLSFAEPKDVHRQSSNHDSTAMEPLRNIEGTIVGIISGQKENMKFSPSRLTTPALGAMACPLDMDELRSTLSRKITENRTITVGNELRSELDIEVDLEDFISRHVAVLGGSGQGKSCFTASVLQQIAKLPNSRIVIFDINGEYKKAFSDNELSSVTEVTTLGKDMKIPYYALGRPGLQRLLVPSEKTQRPALNFAIDSLMHVKWFKDSRGVGLKNDSVARLFDDCRPGDANDARSCIEDLGKIIGKNIENSGDIFENYFGDDNEHPSDKKNKINWPPMKVLGPLVADSHCLETKNSKWIRNSFLYSNISPLVTRIDRFIQDDMFSAVIDTSGGKKIKSKNLKEEGRKICDKIFGGKRPGWKVHIINLRIVAHDLMPFILGSLLELYASTLFERGQKKMRPTLLVLEEAHHYLRPPAIGEDEIGRSLAYERLAKEGRKFGLALWLSTQRPSEISDTVLSQCSNWVSFRLTSEKDLRAVRSANEWADRSEVDRITGLPRQNALLFGGSMNMPVLIRARTADPLPQSEDPDFNSWWNKDQKI